MDPLTWLGQFLRLYVFLRIIAVGSAAFFNSLRHNLFKLLIDLVKFVFDICIDEPFNTLFIWVFYEILRQNFFILLPNQAVLFAIRYASETVELFLIAIFRAR